MALHYTNIYSSPVRIAWDRVAKVEDLVVFPNPTLNDLHQYNFSIEELSDAGIEMPDDNDEALKKAIELFKRNLTYKEWCERFIPGMTTLWPCMFSKPIDEISNAIYSLGVKCTVIKGIASDLTEVSGFALVPRLGGGDIADHVAASYLLSGQIPPVPVVKKALQNPKPIMADELYQAANLLEEALIKEAKLIHEGLPAASYSPKV